MHPLFLLNRPPQKPIELFKKDEDIFRKVLEVFSKTL